MEKYCLRNCEKHREREKGREREDRGEKVREGKDVIGSRKRGREAYREQSIGRKIG